MAVIQNTIQDEFIELNAPDYRWNVILDEDFVKVFEPFRISQKILASCRVDVQDRFVSGPTIFQKCYTITCIIMMSFAAVSVLKTYSVRFNDSVLMFYLWMGGISGVLIVFSISMLHSRFLNNKGNVELYVQMQKIDRVVKTNRNINNLHYKHNRTIVLTLAISFGMILVLSLALAKDDFGVFELVVSAFILQTFIFELSSCSSLIRFFYMRVDLINSIIVKHLNGGNIEIEDLGKKSKSFEYLVDIPAEWQDFEASATDVHLREIFRGFSCFQQQYRFQIFLFCVTIVAWILFTFEYGIFTLQNNNLNKRFMLLDYLLLVSLALIELVILLVLCARSETFFRAVHRTKKLSILVMSRYVDGPLRKKAKHMLKLIDETPPRFSVYRMWSMDAKLVLDIFNLITSLIVTILQFTFM